MKPIACTVLLAVVGGTFLAPPASESYYIYLVENLLDPIAARSAAMAGAISSSPGDFSALMYGPATLGFAKDVHLSVSYYGRSFGDTWGSHCFQAGVIYPAWSSSSLGGSFLCLLDSEVTAMDPQGTPLGTLRPYMVIATASYGTRLIAGLSAGASAKFIFDSVPRTEPFRMVTVSTSAMDVSLLYSLTKLGVSASVSLTNWGPDIDYPGPYRAFALPVAFRAGMSVKARTSDDVGGIYVGFDFSRVLAEYEGSSAHIGGEIDVLRNVFVRTGYVWDQRYDRGGLTIGAGLGIPGVGSLNLASVRKVFGSHSKLHLSLNLQLPPPWRAGPGED